jgi:uncharacterized membrane protein required for colicin V production
MNVGNITLNWFDLLVLVVIGVGIFRGRKRGMSEELLDVLQWLIIVVAAGYTYLPVGSFLAEYTHMTLYWAFIFSYVAIAILVKLLFTAVKRAVGEKLVHSDTFGRLEYYLGMLAGAIRWLCILLVLLAILNARYISREQREANIKMQQENFGSISFPTLSSLQQDIFYRSYSGKWIQGHLKHQLIMPVAAGETKMSDNIYRRREKAVEEVYK